MSNGTPCEGPAGVAGGGNSGFLFTLSLALEYGPRYMSVVVICG